MRLTIGTPVWTTDHHQLGTVDGLLVDAAGAAIRAVMLRRSATVPRDVEIPVADLAADDQGLVWSGTLAEIEALPGFSAAAYTAPAAGAMLPAGYAATDVLAPSSGYVPLPPQPTPTSQQAAPRQPPPTPAG